MDFKAAARAFGKFVALALRPFSSVVATVVTNVTGVGLVSLLGAFQGRYAVTLAVAVILLVAFAWAGIKLVKERDDETARRIELESELAIAQSNQGPKMFDIGGNIEGSEFIANTMSVGAASPDPVLPPVSDDLRSRIVGAYRAFVVWERARETNRPPWPTGPADAARYEAEKRNYREETRTQFLLDHYPRLTALFNELKMLGYGNPRVESGMIGAVNNDYAISDLLVPFAQIAGQAEEQ